MHGAQYKLIQLAAAEAQKQNRSELTKEHVKRIENALMEFVIKDRQPLAVLDSVYLNGLIDGRSIALLKVFIIILFDYFLFSCHFSNL